MQQDKCAMKITTDACIQGAWTPLAPASGSVLDIGTGTGLLALMLAQRFNDVRIDAVEYDHSAAEQAMENANASPFAERINVINADIRSFGIVAQYDNIICNPPFFTGDLLGTQENYNVARHSIALSRQELASAIHINLKQDGFASVLLPYSEYEQWKDIALKCGLFETQRLLIAHRPGAPVKRIISVMAKTPSLSVTDQHLVIQNDSGLYSEDFRQLLKDFYLNL